MDAYPGPLRRPRASFVTLRREGALRGCTGSLEPDGPLVVGVARNAFRIVLTQGLNRQIRRMCKHFGYTVRRLQRVRVVNVTLEGLAPGQWRNLTRAELAGLLPGRTDW